MFIVYRQVLTWWKDHVATLSEKASKSLANPEEYKNLFPNYEQSLVEEAEREGLSAVVSSNCVSIREPQLNVSSFKHNFLSFEHFMGARAHLAIIWVHCCFRTS